MKLISSLFVWVLLNFFSSCMCTAPAYTREIKGINFNEFSDTHTINGSSYFWFKIKTIEQINESKRGFCLTYNKKMAMDITLNPILKSSVKLSCDRQIDTFKPGNQLLVSFINSNEEFSETYYHINNSSLMLDSIYTFNLEAKSSKGEVFTDQKSVKIIR
jgi:hypothetical protein